MIFAVHKPKGPSSNQLLNKIRKLAGTKRVGHAGTLDPLASGVLVVAINRPFTKQLEEVVKKEKEYIATITLGMTSTTDDEEGEKTIVDDKTKPSETEIISTLNNFIGVIKQVPPIYSALKVDGKRAYKLAREGKDVKLEPRDAEIKDIELLEYNYPELKIRVVTGKGVYIRSLARDIGEKLNVGAYMSDLVRTRVGDFRLEEAVEVEDLEKFLKTK